MAEPQPGPQPGSQPAAPWRWWPLVMVAPGLVIGVVGAFVQADRLLVGSAAIPWGAVLVLMVLVACIRGAARLSGTRAGGWLLFGAWLVATLAMSSTTTSGDLALSAGGRQMAYLIGGVIIGSAAATLPVPRTP